MNETLILQLLPILMLGAWTWYISKRLDEAIQELINMEEDMMILAEECQALGSTKIKIRYYD